MIQHHNWSLTEIEDMLPYERTLYSELLVQWVQEENSKIEILAVGIGHDVTRYYKKAIKITDVQELGDVMINQLTNLFSDKIKKTIH